MCIRDSVCLWFVALLAQPAMAADRLRRLGAFVERNLVEDVGRGLADQIACAAYNQFGDIGEVRAPAGQVGERRIVGQQAVADQNNEGAAHHRINQAKHSKLEKTKAWTAGLAVQIGDQDVGAGADQRDLSLIHI